LQLIKTCAGRGQMLPISGLPSGQAVPAPPIRHVRWCVVQMPHLAGKMHRRWVSIKMMQVDAADTGN
ncbi:unnamed protein product, partial [Polarella glacialis]